MPNTPSRFNDFVAAQDDVYAAVLEELRAGKKETHWMWFIFPQLKGLGRSPVAQRFALADETEARAYFAHEVRGPRLLACTQLVLNAPSDRAREIFGDIDCLKFRSCMTLFAQISEPGSVFHETLAKFFDGLPDQATLNLLHR